MKTQERNINSLINDDLKNLELEIQKNFDSCTPLGKALLDFFSSPAKRLRPILGFLFARSVFDEINQAQRDVLCAVELIHNATLIHDDVIDKSVERRNCETIQAKFDENLAVIAGDFLLSIAMEKIVETKSIEVVKIFASALKSTCVGEINQYFSKFKVLSVEEYLKKSEEKTAFLFEIAILSAIITSEKEHGEDIRSAARNFSKNFGIAFQIRDDLLNLINGGNDFDSGIYTAPVIFASEANPDILKEKNIYEAVKKTDAIEKTRNLMDNYFERSILALENITEGVYKNEILRIIAQLKNF